MRFPLLVILLLLPAISYAEETQEKAPGRWGPHKGGSGSSSSGPSYPLGDTVKAPLEQPIRVELLSTARAEGQPEGAALAKSG